MLGWIGPARRRTLDGYRRAADLLNRAAVDARKAGIQIGHHNHDFEFAPLEGTTGYAGLREWTDRDLVGLELDLYWATKAGADPLALVGAWPGRFLAVHIEDMGPDRSMVDVGDGTMDSGQIFSHAKRAGVGHYFVEHDEPTDAKRFARKSFDFLARLSFEEAK